MGPSNFFLEINVGDHFILQVIFNVLVGSLCGDLGKDPRSWTHVDSTLTRKLV